jgi:hypothetical protein
MKIKIIALLCIASFALVSFDKEEPVFNHSGYEAQVMFRKDLSNSIELMDSNSVTQSGKIYFKDDVLFMTKRYEGIHVIDNTNPSQPDYLCFIKIPGCQDISIKQNILYADNATDLVAIDISGLPETIQVVHRIERAFPNPLPPGLDFIPEAFRAYNRPKGTVIVGWKKTN